MTKRDIVFLCTVIAKICPSINYPPKSFSIIKPPDISSSLKNTEFQFLEVPSSL